MERSRRIGCLLVEGEADGERLWEALADLSPAVERADDSSGRLCFLLEAGGVALRYGHEAAWGQVALAEVTAAGGGPARLGLAHTRFGAEVAARLANAEQPCEIVAAPEARWLAPLPLEWLPLPGEALRRLRVLGLLTMGQLAALPQAAVAEQFGPESLTGWRWARGQDDRAVRGRRCQTVLARQMFVAPEARLEALLATAQRLAERALDDLPVDKRAWAIRQLGLVALTETGAQLATEGWLGDTPGAETMRGMLERLLRRWQGQAEVGLVELTVWLWGLEPAPSRQLSLLEAQETDLRWRQVVEVLGRRYPDGLLRSVLANPDAPILTERYTLQRWQA